MTETKDELHYIKIFLPNNEGYWEKISLEIKNISIKRNMYTCTQTLKQDTGRQTDERTNGTEDGRTDRQADSQDHVDKKAGQDVAVHQQQEPNTINTDLRVYRMKLKLYLSNRQV